MSDSDYKPLFAAGDLPPGKAFPVEVDGRRILVCHGENGLFALDDLCPHNGAALGGGKVRKDTISCPMHGARFDLHTGECLATALGCPAIVTHQVRIENGQIEVALSDRPVQQPPL